MNYIKDRQQLTESLVYANSLIVDGPQLVLANGIALEQRNGTMIRTLQNCGTVPVKWKIDEDNNPTADSFHGVLAACTAVDDGTSPILDLSAIDGVVRILGVGGNPRVATFQAFTGHKR